MEIREFFAVVFLLAGLFFFIVSAIGVFRIQDFYCRLHAAGVSETAGLVLCSLGLFLYEGFNQTGVKLFLVFIAVFLASPIGTHIIAKVAYRQSLQAEADADVAKAFGAAQGVEAAADAGEGTGAGASKHLDGADARGKGER